MSGTQTAGQVLGAATTIGGITLLPNTGSSILWTILPLAAITCGLIILASLRITNYLENRKVK